MINVTIKPRQDNRFDIWVTAANGEVLLNSSQGYENVEDAESVVRELFWLPPPYLSQRVIAELRAAGARMPAPAELTVTYRDGTSKTERLR